MVQFHEQFHEQGEVRELYNFSHFHLFNLPYLIRRDSLLDRIFASKIILKIICQVYTQKNIWLNRPNFG